MTKICRDCGVEFQLTEIQMGSHARGIGQIRKCSACKKLKEKNYNKNYHSKNKELINKKSREYWYKNRDTLMPKQAERYKNNKDRYKSASKKVSLKKEYNLTELEYKQMFEKRNSLCDICKKQETAKHQSGIIKSLSVDHCHKTGKVRGLLCNMCNRGLGLFLDNTELLKTAINYLVNNG